MILAALEAAGHEVIAAARHPGVAPASRARRGVRRFPARRARALAGGGPAGTRAAERLPGARPAARPPALGHQRRARLLRVRREHADRRGHLGRRARRRALRDDRGGARGRRRARRLRAVPAAGPPCGAQHLTAATATSTTPRSPRSTCATRAARRVTRARRRLPPRQRHAGDLLGARRRAVRLAARHAGDRVSVVPGLCGRARRGPRRGPYAQPAAAGRHAAGTTTAPRSTRRSTPSGATRRTRWSCRSASTRSRPTRSARSSSTVRHYPLIGRRLAGLGLPTVLVQEGGYAVAEIGTNVAGVLGAFVTRAA